MIRIRHESILLEYVRDCAIQFLRHKYRSIVFDYLKNIEIVAFFLIWWVEGLIV